MGPADDKFMEEPRQEDAARAVMAQDAFHYYKGLIGQMEIAMPQISSRVLLFSSSMGGEGTTEIVVGLGLTLAAAMGRKTAVIDCNTRNPEIHKRFGVDEVGLDEHLKGSLPLEQALLNTTVPNLYVMPLGAGLTSLARIDRDDFQGMVARLREKFEYVLIDSAAVGVNPETSALCDLVDAVVLVVRHGGTRREVVRRAKETIERSGGRILGVVLNKRKFPIPEFLYRRL
ncbi:CpsD/CapB family tyrosine-protein kinase [Candidatus Eisenbacteria bacterium]|uniref:CpsD/CapB family tyrosine-protein kinase n=1 Tax=Eiseniibacteriota bacterium TaxID=2212470 RepID=A0ABV6YP27_UNCEI